MIARANRFHGHGSLRYLYSRGKTVRAEQLALRFIINNNRETWRLAIIVSKKVHKSAIVRNRIRRRLYEIIRLHQDKIDKPYDMALTVFSPSLQDIDYLELESITVDLLKKANIIS